MIELIPGLPDDTLGFVAKGEVTRNDYVEILAPAVEKVLKKHDKVRLLYVLGKDFEGFSGGAMWEDGKLGMGHLTRWEKIAVVADEPWIRHATNVLGYMIPGQVRTFSVAEEAAASEWLTTP